MAMERTPLVHHRHGSNLASSNSLYQTVSNHFAGQPNADTYAFRAANGYGNCNTV